MKKITKKKIKALSVFIFKITLLIILFAFFTRVIKYPEMYFTTLRYQLQNDIEQGNPEAIAYYQNTYTTNGLDLFNN